MDLTEEIRKIAESIFVAVALNTGAAFAHSIISLESLNPR
jgi:hypothetical protein